MLFSNSIFLWGLLAVPLPILLHLFFRRRKAQVAFSTLQFFQSRKRDLAHRRRLRELLLLAVRTLALLCLVLALSRMLFQRMPFSFASHTNAVIVLDDTLSMDRKLGSGGTAFELAAQKALEILDSLSEGDSAALVFLSGRSGVAMTRKRPLVRQLVENAKVTGATGSYSAALQQALGYLNADSHPNREIFVISDFQRNQMPTRPVDLNDAKGLRLYALPIIGGNENLSVEEIRLSTRPQMVNKRMVIPYRIRNSGDSDRDTEVSLVVGGETLNTATVSVPAGELADGQFEYVPDHAGVLSGSVRIADRFLTLDNERVFAVNVCENIGLLFVESDTLSRVRPFYFLKRALDPTGGETLNGVRIEDGFMQELSPKDIAKHHIVALSNPAPLSAQDAAVFARYMSDGGTLLIFGGSRVDRTTLAAFQDERLRALFGDRQPAPLTGLTFKGPLNGLNDLVQMDLLKWQNLHALNLPPTATVLAETHGHPVIAELAVGTGRLIVCAFSSRRDMCNWPELKSYPIAMLSLVTYAAHDPQQNAGIACGRVLHLRALSPDDRTIALRHSDGTVFQVPVDKGEAAFADTWQPGVLTAEHASPRSVAVNPVPAESQLASLGAGDLSKLASVRVDVLKTDAGVDSQIRAYRQGSDLTGLFLFLLMLLLVLELLIGNSYLTAGVAKIAAVPKRPPLT